MSKVQVHVGSPKDMRERFVGAWRRAERGELVHQTHVTFLDFAAMQAALSAPWDELQASVMLD